MKRKSDTLETRNKKRRRLQGPERLRREQQRLRREQQIMRLLPNISAYQSGLTRQDIARRRDREQQIIGYFPNTSVYQSGITPLYFTSEYRQGKLREFYEQLINEYGDDGNERATFRIDTNNPNEPRRFIRGYFFHYRRENSCEYLSVGEIEGPHGMNERHSFDIFYCPNLSNKYMVKIFEQQVDEFGDPIIVEINEGFRQIIMVTGLSDPNV